MKPNLKYAWAEAKSSLMLKHAFSEWKSISGAIFTGLVVAIYFVYSKKFDYSSMSGDENFIWILFSCLTIAFVIMSYVSGKFFHQNNTIKKSTYNIAIWLMNAVINSYAFVASLSFVEAVYNKNFSVLLSMYMCLYYADNFIKIRNDYMCKDYKVIATIIVGKKINDPDD